MKYCELSKLKSCNELNRNAIWTFDCETKDGLKGSLLYCWSLATNSDGKGQAIKTYSGKTIDSFFQILIKLNKTEKKQIIFVHNLSFDVRFLIDYCIRNNITFTPIFTASSCIMFFIKDLSYKFIDSFQFLLCSQEEAEIIYEVPTELTKINCLDIFKKDYKKWTDSEKEKLLQHNKNDVLALQFILKRFREQMFEISNVDLLECNTLAGLSLKAFRKSLKENIVNCYINTHYDIKTKKYHYILQSEKYEFVKNSYYGGRTECFNHQFVKNIKCYDIVSMFPSMMRFKDFPKGIPYWEKDSQKIYESLHQKLSIIEAKMIPNYSEKYPILPFRKDNRTIFGNFNEIGIWTNAEIEYAIQRGYSFEFIRALIFPEKFNPFSDFIDKFFEIKSKNKGAKRQQAKIILNSSYGKFGQRVKQKSTIIKFFQSENEAISFYEDKIDKDEHAILEYNEIYKCYSVRYTEITTRLKSYQIVHLSSFITSYARIELLENGIHLLSDNNIPIYYCDTDSIDCEENTILNIGKKLGKWDLDCEYLEFKCIAPKCYIAKWLNPKTQKVELIIKVKGIRKAKIKDWIKNNTEISQILTELEKEIIIDEQYLPVKSSLIRNKTALSSAQTIKKLSLNDVKRKILSDESTIPLSDKI